MGYDKIYQEIKKLKTLREKVNSLIPAEDESLIEEIIDKLQGDELQLELQNSEMRESQIQLEYSRDQYASLFDFAPVGLIILNEKGVIKDVNLTCLKIFKKEKNELVNFPFAVFLRGDQKNSFFSYLNKCKQSNTKLPIELQFFIRNDESLFIKFFCTTSQNFQDKNLDYKSAIIDITAEKKINDEVKKLASIVETSDNAIYSISLNGEITSWNESAEKIFGYKKDEIVGKPHSIIVPADLKKKTEEVYDKIKKGEKIKHFETIRVKKNGLRIDVSKSMTPIKDDKGNIIGVAAIAHDITERKLYEEALRESNARFRQLAENISSVFFIINPESKRLIYVSPAFEEIWEKPVDELFNDVNKWMERIHPQDKDRVRTELKFRDITVEFQSEFRIIRPNGKYKWIYLREYPVKDNSGKVYRTVGIAEDITSFKKIQKELRGLLAEKDVLLKETHHRVKNNLQVISSLLSLQAKNLNDPNYVEIFDESRARIQSIALIHEHLYKTKKFSRLNFHEYVKMLSDNIFNSYFPGSRNVSLNLDIEDVFISMNIAIDLGLILNELITNSLKYAFTNSDKGAINIAMNKKENKTIELIYKDNGKGFPEDINFRNTDSLGLQLVMTFVDQIEGSIELKNKVGTEFLINFPAELENDRR